eukprot:g18921.t1
MGLLLAFSLFSLTYAAGCKYPEFPNSCAAIQTTLSASGSTNLAKGDKICIKQSIRIATSPSPVPPQLFRPFVDFLIPDGLDASMATVKQVGSGGQDIPLVENQEWMRRTLPGMPNPNGIVNATYCGCSAGGLTFPLLCSVDHPYLYRDPEQCPVNEMNLPPDYVVPLPEGYTLIAVQTLSSQLAAGGPLVAVELCNICVISDPPANLLVYGRGGFLLGSTLTVSCPADPPKQGQLNNNPSNWQVIAYQQSLVNVIIVFPGGGTPGMGWNNNGNVNITINPGPGGGGGPGPNISGCIKYMYAENTAFTGAVVINGKPICICGDGTPGCGPGCSTGICSATGTFALGCAKTPPFNATYSSCPNNCTANNMPGQCPSISNTYGPCNDACDCVPLESVCPTCNLSYPPTFNYLGPCQYPLDSPPCDGSSDGGGGVVEFCFPQSYAFSIEFGTIVYANNGTHLIEGGTYRPTTRTCGFIYTYQNGTSVMLPDTQYNGSFASASVRTDKALDYPIDNDGSGGISPGDDLKFRLDLNVDSAILFANWSFGDFLDDPLDVNFNYNLSVSGTINGTALTYCSLAIPPPDANGFSMNSYFSYNGTSRIPVNKCMGSYSKVGFTLNLGELLNACFAQSNPNALYGGPLAMTICYFATVNYFYSQQCTNGEPDPVNVGDCLCNIAVFSADYTNNGGGSTSQMPPEVCSPVDPGKAISEIYAYNDMYCPCFPACQGTNILGCNGVINPGDKVTFIFYLVLPITQWDVLMIGQSAPLPIFTTGGFVPNPFSYKPCNEAMNCQPYCVNEIQFGPAGPGLTIGNMSNITLDCTECPDETGTWKINYPAPPNPRSNDSFVVSLLSTYIATANELQECVRLTVPASVLYNSNLKCAPPLQAEPIVKMQNPRLCITTFIAASVTQNPLSQNLVPHYSGSPSSTGYRDCPSTQIPAVSSNKKQVFRISEGDVINMEMCVENTGLAPLYDVVLQIKFPNPGPPNYLTFFDIPNGTYICKVTNNGVMVNIDADSVYDNNTGILNLTTNATGAYIRVEPMQKLCVEYKCLATDQTPTLRSPNTVYYTKQGTVLRYSSLPGGPNFVGPAQNPQADPTCFLPTVTVEGNNPCAKLTLTKWVCDPANCNIPDQDISGPIDKKVVKIGEEITVEQCLEFPESTAYMFSAEFRHTNKADWPLVVVMQPTVTLIGDCISTTETIVIGTEVTTQMNDNRYGNIYLGDVYCDVNKLPPGSTVRNASICFMTKYYFDAPNKVGFPPKSISNNFQNWVDVKFKTTPMEHITSPPGSTVSSYYAIGNRENSIYVSQTPAVTSSITNANVEIVRVCFNYGSTGYTQSCVWDVLGCFYIPPEFTLDICCSVTYPEGDFTVNSTFTYNATTRKATYTADQWLKHQPKQVVQVCFVGYNPSAQTGVGVDVTASLTFNSTNCAGDPAKHPYRFPLENRTVTFRPRISSSVTNVTSKSKCEPNGGVNAMASQMTICECVMVFAKWVLPLGTTSSEELRLFPNSPGITSVNHVVWTIGGNNGAGSNGGQCIFPGACNVTAGPPPDNITITVPMNDSAAYDFPKLTDLQGPYASTVAYLGDICVPITNLTFFNESCRTVSIMATFCSGGDIEALKMHMNWVGASSGLEFLSTQYPVANESSSPYPTLWPGFPSVLTIPPSTGVSFPITIVDRTVTYDLFFNESTCMAGSQIAVCLNRSNPGPACVEGNVTFKISKLENSNLQFPDGGNIYFPDELCVGQTQRVCTVVNVTDDLDCAPICLCYRQMYMNGTCLAEGNITTDEACIMISATPSTSPSRTPSRTSSRTASRTPSNTPTSSRTRSASRTPSMTPSNSPTQSPTSSVSVSATSSISRSATPSISVSATSSISQSATSSISQSSSNTRTPSSSRTPTSSISVSPSISVTRSASMTSSSSRTATSSITETPSASPTPRQQICECVCGFCNGADGEDGFDGFDLSDMTDMDDGHDGPLIPCDGPGNDGMDGDDADGADVNAKSKGAAKSKKYSKHYSEPKAKDGVYSKTKSAKSSKGDEETTMLVAQEKAGAKDAKKADVKVRDRTGKDAKGAAAKSSKSSKSSKSVAKSSKSSKSSKSLKGDSDDQDDNDDGCDACYLVCGPGNGNGHQPDGSDMSDLSDGSDMSDLSDGSDMSDLSDGSDSMSVQKGYLYAFSLRRKSKKSKESGEFGEQEAGLNKDAEYGVSHFSGTTGQVVDFSGKRGQVIVPAKEPRDHSDPTASPLGGAKGKVPLKQKKGTAEDQKLKSALLKQKTRAACVGPERISLRTLLLQLDLPGGDTGRISFTSTAVNKLMTDNCFQAGVNLRLDDCLTDAAGSVLATYTTTGSAGCGQLDGLLTLLDGAGGVGDAFSWSIGSKKYICSVEEDSGAVDLSFLSGCSSQSTDFDLESGRLGFKSLQYQGAQEMQEQQPISTVMLGLMLAGTVLCGLSTALLVRYFFKKENDVGTQGTFTDHGSRLQSNLFHPAVSTEPTIHVMILRRHWANH